MQRRRDMHHQSHGNGICGYNVNYYPLLIFIRLRNYTIRWCSPQNNMLCMLTCSIYTGATPASSKFNGYAVVVRHSGSQVFIYRRQAFTRNCEASTHADSRVPAVGCRVHYCWPFCWHLHLDWRCRKVTCSAAWYTNMEARLLDHNNMNTFWRPVHTDLPCMPTLTDRPYTISTNLCTSPSFYSSVKVGPTH